MPSSSRLLLAPSALHGYKPYRLAVCVGLNKHAGLCHKCILLFLQVLLTPFVLLMWKTPWQGAQTTIYLATEKGIEGLSGCYFADCKEKKVSGKRADPEKAKELWKVSEKLLEIDD